MQIHITGHHIDVGGALHDYVQERLEKAVTKYFEHAINGDVVFTKQRAIFHVKIHVNQGTGTGIEINSDGESDDAHAAFDTALTRIEKQLQRYKSRIKDHHKRKSMGEVLDATKYILSSDQEKEVEQDAPVIVAEQQARIETLTVGEAVMKMELASLTALMFINSANGRFNIVYKRADGNVSWVDPRQQQKTA
ncbi:MAG: raiA [Rickettsiales bacterium]|jgi:ribosomal subunit interface protein|nr:raiA [Rickettsiales bacterium]